MTIKHLPESDQEYRWQVAICTESLYTQDKQLPNHKARADLRQLE